VSLRFFQWAPDRLDQVHFDHGSTAGSATVHRQMQHSRQVGLFSVAKVTRLSMAHQIASAGVQHAQRAHAWVTVQSHDQQMH
jgi:hypothetical protein